MTERGFSDFINLVDQSLRSEKNEKDYVLAIRSLLRDALRQEGFLLDCLEHVMSTMDPMLSVWHNPPIHTDAELDYSIRIIYWPPHYKNNPHQHNSWTVTGVLHNRIKVAIYRLDEEASDVLLIEEKSFMCEKDEVGYIYSPCIHNITNPTESTSVSLHIFSALGNQAHRTDDAVEEYSDKQTIWYPSPRIGEITKDVARRALLTHVEILSRISSARSIELLDTVFRLGDIHIKLASIKAMCQSDSTLAASRLDELANIAPVKERGKLRALSSKLLEATQKT